MSLATQEQELRARWDLLLLDLEHRGGASWAGS
jgi:hypothetical protein